MPRYEVDIGRPEGGVGDTLTVRADSKTEALEMALANENMLNNPAWEILGEPRLLG